MTYLPGSDEAIYPGTNHITADAVIEDDRHNVVLNLAPIAYPLDGLVPSLLFAVEAAGLWDAATAMVRNKISAPIQMQALQALQSEPSIARVLKVTLTPADAERIATDLNDAALEPRKCRCGNYATDGVHCPAHQEQDEDRDVAWDAAS